MKPPVLNRNWPENVLALYEHDMEQYWDRRLATHMWNQYQNQLDLYKGFALSDSPLKVLDVGCAQATLAILLAEQGHQVCAVDLRQEFLDYAKSRVEYGNISFVKGNVLELELDQKFDLIFANQIIEHLVYPQVMVEQLLRYLSEDGVLVVTTPNWRYIMNNLPSFKEIGDPAQWESQQFTADSDGHFYAYKGAELKEIFEQSGASNIEVSVYETPFISGHIKVRYLHKLLSYRLLKSLDAVVLKLPWVRSLLSHQLLVVARK